MADARMNDAAAVDIEGLAQGAAFLEGSCQPALGKEHGVMERRVGQGMGRGVGDDAGHIRDGVMHDALLGEYGIRVGGHSRGLGDTALVNRYIDDGSSGFHAPNDVL